MLVISLCFGEFSVPNVYEKGWKKGRMWDLPPYPIDFEGKEMVTTEELLEILGISYSALQMRIRRSEFPRPEIDGHCGRVAQYRVSEICEWLKIQGFVFAA
jgi:predicted DNA-binding transcriptional regulator AlpA